jgi:hypothetical protein
VFDYSAFREVSVFYGFTAVASGISVISELVMVTLKVSVVRSLRKESGESGGERGQGVELGHQGLVQLGLIVLRIYYGN